MPSSITKSCAIYRSKRSSCSSTGEIAAASSAAPAFYFNHRALTASERHETIVFGAAATAIGARCARPRRARRSGWGCSKRGPGQTAARNRATAETGRTSGSTSPSASSGWAFSACGRPSLRWSRWRCSSCSPSLGITRLTVDDSLSELFRSETPEFKTFEEETAQISLQRIRRARRRRGQERARPRADRGAAPSRHRLAARRRRPGPHLDLLRPPARARRAACPNRCSPRICRRAPPTTRWSTG